MFDFPASPSINDTYSAYGVTYRFNGYGWVSTAPTTTIWVGDTAPNQPVDNSLWYETDSGVLWLRFNDTNSTQWIQISGPPIPASNLYLPLSGGNLTGGIAIQPTSGWAAIDLKKSGSGQASVITGQTGSLYRWWLYLGDTLAETGSNVGSDFVVGRWSDAGASIDFPFRIARSNGQATFSSPLNAYQVLIKPGAGNASVILTGVANEVYGFAASNAQGRWMIQLGDGSSESGSNAGSNFAVHRYADNGSYLGAVLTIARATGKATFSVAPDFGTASPASNGYVRLPNGLLLQWGYDGGAGGASSKNVNFPISFPGACLNINVSMYGDPGASTSSISCSAQVISTSTFTYYPRYGNNGGLVGNATQGVFWIAIGY